MSGKFNPNMDTNGAFFPKSGPVSVAEYALITLNILKYPWKCLKKLFWLYQGSEYAWSSYVFHRLLKIPGVLNVPEFWIWHCCTYTCYTEFWIWLNMAQYASIMPEYASICLNFPQCLWTWLNIAECLNKLCQGFKNASSS